MKKKLDRTIQHISRMSGKTTAMNKLRGDYISHQNDNSGYDMENNFLIETVQFRDQMLTRHIRANIDEINRISEIHVRVIIPSLKVILEQRPYKRYCTVEPSLTELYGSSIYLLYMAKLSKMQHDGTKGILVDDIINTEDFFTQLSQTDRELIGETTLQKLTVHLIERIRELVQRMTYAVQHHLDVNDEILWGDLK